MKKYIYFFKGILLFCLIISSIIVLYYFYYYNQRYEWYSLELKINWMFTISYFILFFYLLLFLINFQNYNKIFLVIILIGAPLWIILYFLELFKIEFGSLDWNIIREAVPIICFSIMSPGLTINFIRYIRYNSNQDIKGKVFRHYHIHEGFVGILFLVFAFFLWIIRNVMVQYEILRTELRIYLAIEMILLFLFLFSGSFLIFRDWRDIIKFKFIENRKRTYNSNISSIFHLNSPESAQFFKSPRVLLYPFGIFLNSFSVSLFIHGTDFFPVLIFHLNHETLVLIGVILCFIAGGMLGIDWYRVFAKFYPDLYQEFEQILNDLRKHDDSNGSSYK